MAGAATGDPGALKMSRQSGLSGWPSTRIGWVSLGLFAGFLVLMSLNRPLAIMLHFGFSLLYNGLTLAVGLIAAVAGLVAAARAHERSWVVWLAILLAVSFVLVETIVGALAGG